MRVLDGLYWVVQVACFALAALIALTALHLMYMDWSLSRSIPANAPHMGDTYYVTATFHRFLTTMVGAVVCLGVGGTLHWLRRIYQRRPEVTA